jgi:hypothetical protein
VTRLRVIPLLAKCPDRVNYPDFHTTAKDRAAWIINMQTGRLASGVWRRASASFIISLLHITMIKSIALCIMQTNYTMPYHVSTHVWYNSNLSSLSNQYFVSKSVREKYTFVRFTWVKQWNEQTGSTRWRHCLRNFVPSAIGSVSTCTCFCTIFLSFVNWTFCYVNGCSACIRRPYGAKHSVDGTHPHWSTNLE